MLVVSVVGVLYVGGVIEIGDDDWCCVFVVNVDGVFYVGCVLVWVMLLCW